MNQGLIILLKALRKLFLKFKPNSVIKFEVLEDPDQVAEIIYKSLLSNEPCMIARFGSTELACITNFLSIKLYKNHLIDYISGKIKPWWWDKSIMQQMQDWSGFFPVDEIKLEQFARLMIEDKSELDVLASWLPDELCFESELSDTIKIHFELLNPYFSSKPWTRALEEKKVLVVHPFASTIESQYKKRELLFKDNLLPSFHLKTVKAVQSIAGSETQFADWFVALDYMKGEIDKCDYDICLIGCGAYGFPLAAHVKRMGKKAIHMGGSLQLLFGIRGKRWENPDYNPNYNFANLINEHWVKPGEEEKPKGADMVEGACYW